MDITKMIELFQKNRVPYLRNHVLNPPNNHNAIISQWGRWWIEDTNDVGSNRGIFDEAIACKGKRRADIMFLEQSTNKIFKIKGVAEIENNINDDENKFKEKLDTLALYDESTERFPDLEFAILNALMVVDRNNTAEDFFTPLIKDTRNYSKNSRLSWIIFLLFKIPYTTEYQEVNTPYKGSKTTIFGRYLQEGAYVILKEGKELGKELTRMNWGP